MTPCPEILRQSAIRHTTAPCTRGSVPTGSPVTTVFPGDYPTLRPKTFQQQPEGDHEQTPFRRTPATPFKKKGRTEALYRGQARPHCAIPGTGKDFCVHRRAGTGAGSQLHHAG